MLTARKGLDGHSVYGRVRNASETLEKLGLDGDDEGRDQRVRQLREEGATLGTLLQYGLPTEQLWRGGYLLPDCIGNTPDVQQLLAKVGHSIETLCDNTALDFSGRELGTMVNVLAELLPSLKVFTLK
jgi:hypothetical protein